MPDYRITGGPNLVEYYVFDVGTPEAALDQWARDSGYEHFDEMCDAGRIDADGVEVQPLSEVADEKLPDDVLDRRDEADSDRRERRVEQKQHFKQAPTAQQDAEDALKAEGYTLERAEPLVDRPDQHVTYWTRDENEGTVVKQVHPNGDVRTYTGDEWERVRKKLDE